MTDYLQAGYQPSQQFIQFAGGSDNKAPIPSNFATHVLHGDHHITHLDGGDPTDGFSSFVQDVLVYPSSEKWESLLSGDRIRPYIDLSISEYNTLRLPVATHDYNLYVDDARIYGNLIVDGSFNFNSNLSITELSSDNFSVDNLGNAQFETVTAEIHGKTPVVELHANTSLSNTQTGTIFNCMNGIQVTLPTNGEDGVTFTLMWCGASGQVDINGAIFARGSALIERYSACTIYWSGGAWYAFGDLV